LNIASERNVYGLVLLHLPSIECPKGKFGLKAGGQIRIAGDYFAAPFNPAVISGKFQTRKSAFAATGNPAT
jgi:hypothetical protein